MEHLDGDRYVVRGGKTPHLVDLADAIRCDCKDHEFAGGDCAHILAVHRFCGNGHAVPTPAAAPPATPAPAVAHAPRFRLYTADDLLALPAPEWLLERHLPENSLSVLYGPPASGKSFLALAWAVAIATGQPWLDHATRRGLVLYVSAEGGAGLGQRVQALQAAHALSGAIDLLFVRETLNLLEARDVTALLADLDAWTDTHGTPASGMPQHPGLVVIDTMARCMPGGDENSAQDVGRVIAGADQIRQETSAAVLIIHHTGKSGELERGSSALRGAADSMFLLKSEDGVLTLECTKQKDAAAIDERRLRLVAVEPSCVVEPVEGEAPRKATRNTWKVLQALLEGFRGGESTVGVWQRVSGVPEPSFYRTLKQLLEMGYVTKTGAKYVVSSAGEMALKATLILLSGHSHESGAGTLTSPGVLRKHPGESSGTPR